MDIRIQKILYNIPEGMAVGILYAGWASGTVAFMTGFALMMILDVALG